MTLDYQYISGGDVVYDIRVVGVCEAASEVVLFSAVVRCAGTLDINSSVNGFCKIHLTIEGNVRVVVLGKCSVRVCLIVADQCADKSVTFVVSDNAVYSEDKKSYRSGDGYNNSSPFRCLAVLVGIYLADNLFDLFLPVLHTLITLVLFVVQGVVIHKYVLPLSIKTYNVSCVKCFFSKRNKGGEGKYLETVA